MHKGHIIAEKNINILITSVSRKIWLVNAFKNALKQYSSEGNVVSVDTDPLSVGLYESDAYHIVPQSSDAKFIPSLLDICKKENINLIVPTRDAELPIFAKYREKFENCGIKVMVSDLEAINICNDKYKFYQFLINKNMPTPKTYTSDQIDISSINYPLIIKSRQGSGSRGIFKIDNETDLRFFINYVSDPIIQEFIKGKEYTIDVFSDFSGKVITVVPRERIETFCGESYKGMTVEDKQISDLSKKLAESLGTIGHITIQCIKNDEGIKFIEINPRFGGGAALGIRSGANTPLMLIRLINGEKLEPQIGEYEKGLIMLRYTRDMFISKNR